MALDIGPDAIVAVHSTGAGTARVRQAIVHPLPVGLVADGEVASSSGLADELRTLFSEHRLPRDVRVGLAHPRLIVRMLELPTALKGAELDAAVRHLAQDLLPMGLDEVRLDYRPAGISPVDAEQQRVLLAAARSDGIERLVAALDEASLKPLQIQLSGLALMRALDPPPIAGDAVLYVQAGGLTNVVIAQDGEALLVRAASTGSETIAVGLAERAGISHDAARVLAATVGLHPAADKAIDEDLVAQVHTQIREGMRRIAAEVRSSIEFYAARPDARPIAAAVLTGPVTTWPGVAEVLKSELGLPVVPAARDAWPQFDAGAIAPERLDVAIGLALAASGERPDLRAVATHVRSESYSSPRIAQASCAVAALAAAAVVYGVVLSNQVSSGKEHVVQLASQATVIESKAAALKPYHDAQVAAATRKQSVINVAATRFDWERSLRQLAEVTPGDVWLTSVKGTQTPSTQLDGGGGDGSTTSLRGVRVTPAFELSGCATNERLVPDFMDRLSHMTGATDIGFARSARLEPVVGAAAAATPGGTATGDCRGSDQKAPAFSLVTFFDPVAVPAGVTSANPTASTGSTTAAAGAPSSPAAPASAPITPATTAPAATAPANQTASTGVKP